MYRKKPTIKPSEVTIKTTEGVNFLESVMTRNLMEYGQIAYGQGQNTPSAPLKVPSNFATQVTYNSAINSTIIRNPSPISVLTYDQIRKNHPVVKQCIVFLISTIISRIKDYTNSNKEHEKIVRNTIERCGKIRLFKGLGTSLWAGHSDIKINWGDVGLDGSFDAHIDDDGYSTPKNILVLPQNSILLAVTPEGLLDPNFGVMQYYYNINSAWNQNPLAFSGRGNNSQAAYGGDFINQRQVTFNPLFLSPLSEEWRIHHTFSPDGLDGNHYGESLIRSAYGDIVEQANLDFKISVATTYKAQPFMLIETDSGSTVVDPNNINGKAVKLATDVRNKMAQMAQKGYMVVDGIGVVKITEVNNTADLEQMIKIRESYDDRIRTALFTSNLTGNQGSYANSIANNSNVKTIIRNFTSDLIDTVLNQFVKKILDNAVGEYDDLGHFEISDDTIEDSAIWAKIFESAKQTGYYDPLDVDDVNSARNKTTLKPVSSISKSMKETFEAGNKGSTDMNRGRQDAGTPYANGKDTSDKNNYNGKVK